MKPNTVAVKATTSKPSRLLIALAAAWMILSLAIGGAVTAESRLDGGAPQTTVTGTSQR